MAGKKRARLNKRQRSEKIKRELQYKRDRDSIWEVIKGRKYVTTKTAARLAGVGSTRYASFRLRELGELGNVKRLNKCHGGSLWEVVK